MSPLTDLEKSSLDQFFSRFSEAFLLFPDTHHLKVEKYWHAFSSWRFRFKHPKGGVAAIEVFRESEGQISVYCFWWLDDYDQGTRFSRSSNSSLLDIENIQMAEFLEEALREIISWPLDSWTETGTGFGPSWKQHFSKEAFVALSDDFPVLKL